MLYTITTSKNMDEVQKQIQESVKEIGFGILKEYAFKEILQDKGYPIQKDIRVVELCNPAAAQAALSVHPEISVYLPCRISFYESNGNTVISTISVDDILVSFELEDEFKEHMKNIFDKLKKLISSLE